MDEEAFRKAYDAWMRRQIDQESNPRRRERLRKGVSCGTVCILKTIWFPLFGHFDHLHAEYEVRDWNNQVRCLDLAFMPGGAKGCLEINDYRSHARDIEVERFKDLNMKQALLVLDDWLFLPIALPSVREDPGMCRQLVLAFVGKLLSTGAAPELNWMEAETVRFARRRMTPFSAKELASHLRLSESTVRRVLRRLVQCRKIEIAAGNLRYRKYRLPAS